MNYIHDDRGQLIKVIDPAGEVAEYVYDPAGNIQEIKRYSIGAPGTLTVVGFTPQSGPPGTSVTIIGQGFGASANENVVRFGTAAATVDAATPTQLNVTVPNDAQTAPITVAVGDRSDASDTAFVINRPQPAITSIVPRFAIAAPTLSGGLNVVGEHLQGATFSFLPESSPPKLRVTAASIQESGTSAVLQVAMTAGVSGEFVLIADGRGGRSDAQPRPSNTLKVLPASTNTQDPDGDDLTNANEVSRQTDPDHPDTDRDGFTDGFEVAAGTDPLNSGSRPVIARAQRELRLPAWSALNVTIEGRTELAPREVITTRPSLLNTTDDGRRGTAPREKVGDVFSVKNGAGDGP